MVQHTLSTCIRNIPSRLMVGFMIFVACFFSYMLRVNISVNIIAMVQPSRDALSNKVHIPECSLSSNKTVNENMNITVPDYGVRYDWDQKTQGLILGAYFWGYIFTQIPGGLLVEKFGARHLIGWVGIISALLTIVTPMAADVHFGVVVAIRFIIGIANGVLYPSLQWLISRWAPACERGKWTGALLGGSLGPVATWPLLGTLVPRLGWPSAFYLPGVLVLLSLTAWYLWVYDAPSLHPRISEKEKEYIEERIGRSSDKRKKLPPYGQILKSPPFLSLLLLHFGNCWGLSLILTNGPKYLSEVLGFNLKGAGTIAALPYLARVVMAFVFGAIGDKIREKEFMSVTAIRKWFVIFSHFIPGILILIQPTMGCNVTLAVLLIILSLGFNGACTLTNIQNAQDLSPNFAGTIYGIINCAGSATGFITPMLAGYITQENNGLHEWQIVFTIGAIVYITSGILFCIFGSGEVQPWNDIQTSEETTNQGQDNKGFDQSEDQKEKQNGVLQNNNDNIIESTKV